MYNILILDDEKQERDMIKFLLNQLPDLFHILEARNGKEGLNLLDQHPIDILITDVKMPFMMGTELAEHAKVNHPELKIIFFSGHDDYQHLKRALLVNATTYILKPVQPHEFFNAIHQIVEELDQKKNTKLTDEQRERALQKHIIRELINEVPLASLKKQYPFIPFDFLDTIFYYVVCQMNGYVRSEHIPQIDQYVRQLENADYFKHSANQFIIYFHMKDHIEVIQKNMAFLNTSLDNKLIYHITERIESVECLHQRFYQAEKKLEEKAFYQNKRTVTDHSGKSQAVEEEDMLISEVIKAIKIGDKNVFKQKIQAILDYHHNHPTVSVPFIRFFYANFIERLSTETLIHLSENKETTIKKIIEADHLEEILVIVESIIAVINRYLDEVYVSSNLSIQNVKKYIISHYHQELYLELLAEQVSLSPRYLSDLFKKEEGIGITRYIKQIRITEAKKLLMNTNLKVADIAAKVGYTNYPYFVKTFREETGLPPEKYRQKHFHSFS
ncbi:Two-component response regulator, YesN/AraC family, consists of REC and AraC-type DNA-binding domains [Evansella caseinilytica]|uniref:Two-component response regulator, YesN/AraC family, consists of REC and AraC-type DNA-binding domains n=1 Tax=Evansella caseinilytica TaxID=1503961 RepID=A0A1H3V0L4_9BACI|nr:helix-turn-helix domain-containing protein [Evansella caseinilytica]SDZ67639.1 Two-component response regulator, YesN/AraC family, consists of REC and AraC-type DNA-binding domains [Evansella caseinilytica]